MKVFVCLIKLHLYLNQDSFLVFCFFVIFLKHYRPNFMKWRKWGIIQVWTNILIKFGNHRYLQTLRNQKTLVLDDTYQNISGIVLTRGPIYNSNSCALTRFGGQCCHLMKVKRFGCVYVCGPLERVRWLIGKVDWLHMCGRGKIPARTCTSTT